MSGYIFTERLHGGVWEKPNTSSWLPLKPSLSVSCLPPSGCLGVEQGWQEAKIALCLPRHLSSMCPAWVLRGWGQPFTQGQTLTFHVFLELLRGDTQFQPKETVVFNKLPLALVPMTKKTTCKVGQVAVFIF